MIGISRIGLGQILVAESDDGEMGGFEIFIPNYIKSGSPKAKAAFRFIDKDGVLVLATLYVDEKDAPISVDVWKTNFQPLRKWPQLKSDLTAISP